MVEKAGLSTARVFRKELKRQSRRCKRKVSERIERVVRKPDLTAVGKISVHGARKMSQETGLAPGRPAGQPLVILW